MIGHGSYGIVYKALDTMTKQYVAMKEIALHRMDPQGVALTMQEIELQ
jgi:serine/threonine protein kinase